MKTRKRTLLVPMLIAAGAPLMSAAATGDQANATADDKQKDAQVVGQASPVGDAASAPAQSSSAQDSGGLQEVVVTAERRTSGVQKTAAAVSVRKGDDLLQQGKTSVRQVLEDIPAVVVTENQGMFLGGSDTAGNNVTIRGIKSNNNSGSPLPAVPTTAVYTDGVYEGIGGNYDLDRVEVLRGPQGTLYGRSATSGVVASYTRNPSLDGFEAEGSAELGSFSLRHYSGAVNVPLDEQLALRVAADHFERNGYDSAAGGALTRNAGRVKLLYKPNSDISLLLGAALERNLTHTGGKQGNLTGPDTFSYDTIVVEDGPNVWAGRNTFKQYWLNLDWNLGPATLTYLPAVRRWDQDAELVVGGPGGGYLDQTIKTPFDQFMTQELRLASNDTGAFKWLLGGFYYDNRLQTSNHIAWLSGQHLVNQSDTDKRTSNLGAFGEATYSFADVWRLTGGIRFDRTHVRSNLVYTNNLNYACNTPIGAFNCPSGASDPLPNSPNAGDPEDLNTLTLSGSEGARNYRNTTYKLRLEHDLTSSNLLYAMVSTGFIPGDVQVAAGNVNGQDGVPVASDYGAEQLTAYEFGSKNRFLSNRLQVNGGVFFYDYGGFRTSVRPNPNNPGEQVLLTVPAKVMGAEIETQYLFTPQDQLSLSYSYTNAYFYDQPDLFTQNVAEKRTVPGAIPRSFNAAYRHSFVLPDDSSLDFRIDARFQSAYNLDNVNAQSGQEGLAYQRVGNQWVSNLSGSWRSSSGDYSVTAYVRNLTNNRYKTFVQLQSTNPLIANGTQYDPRTFGVVLTARY